MIIGLLAGNNKKIEVTVITTLRFYIIRWDGEKKSLRSYGFSIIKCLIFMSKCLSMICICQEGSVVSK